MEESSLDDVVGQDEGVVEQDECVKRVVEDPWVSHLFLSLFLPLLPVSNYPWTLNIRTGDLWGEERGRLLGTRKWNGNHRGLLFFYPEVEPSTPYE